MRRFKLYETCQQLSLCDLQVAFLVYFPCFINPYRSKFQILFSCTRSWSGHYNRHHGSIFRSREVSLPRSWGFRSTVEWRCVIWNVFSEVTRECNVFIYRTREAQREASILLHLTIWWWWSYQLYTNICRFSSERYRHVSKLV